MSKMQDRTPASRPSVAEEMPELDRLPRHRPHDVVPHPSHADVHLTHPAPVSPLLLVLAMVAGGYALLFIVTIVAQTPVKLVGQIYLGLDFKDFWTAAGDVLAGRDPYLSPRFVTPPLSWIPFLPLSWLSRPQATLVFLCVNATALVIGIRALVRFYRLESSLVLVIAIIGAFSPATLMLLDRGNLDGLVFLPLCAFIALQPNRMTSPLALAAATCLKLYPGIFILAFIAHRRIGAALIAGGAVLSTVVLMPAGDLAFLHSQLVRAGGMRIEENLSGLAPFWAIDELLSQVGTIGLGLHPALLTGAMLYAGALGTCLWLDGKLIGRVGNPDMRLLLATYAGFCISMPSLVFLYSGVCLFIPLAALGQRGLSASPTRLRGFALALGLTMLPARSFDLTLGADWAKALNLLPIAGSVLLIVEAVGLRFDLRQSSGVRNAGAALSPPRAEASAGIGRFLPPGSIAAVSRFVSSVEVFGTASLPSIKRRLSPRRTDPRSEHAKHRQSDRLTRDDLLLPPIDPPAA